MMQGTPKRLIQWLLEQPAEKTYQVKEVRMRRTLTQNAYYWTLLNKLAARLGMGDFETHCNMLRDYGVCSVFSVRDDVPFESYFKYCEEIGTGEANGQRFRHIKVYKGSSQMDSAEFTRLLHGLIEECEAQGIPTMTPAEADALRFVEGSSSVY